MTLTVKQYLKLVFKVTTIGSISASVLGYAYLQYINSVLGPISLNKEEAINFYQERYNYSEKQAKATYYFALWNLSIARIFQYHTYLGYCDRLNRKIINYSLENYQKAEIQQKIEQAGSIHNNQKAHQKIYEKLEPLRRKNAQNLAYRQYVIKRIMDYQKQLNTSALPSVPQQNLEKIQKLHRYLIQVGSTLKKPELMAKINKLADYEKRHPKDMIHKILLI